MRPYLKHSLDAAHGSGARQRGGLRVVIADDHRMFLDAVSRLLTRRGFAVVGVAADGEEAVRIVTATQPDVAILDLIMPSLNGLDAARALLTTASETAVVLVTGSGDLGFVLEGMTLGVRGFVVKTAAVEELFDAVKAAGSGATYVSPAYEEAVKAALPTARAVGASSLTLREREVLRLIAEGKTSKQVASALRIAAKTVDTHRTRIMKKLDIHDVAGLVRYAIRERIASA
jgi:DNA-binding NarL/FixJ family response regulator